MKCHNCGSDVVYTIARDLVLDNCIGSGTTAIACINTKRNFIGMELSEEYCKIANERLSKLNNGNDGIPPKPKVLGILPNFI
jgi:DNA modification methylase